MTLLIEGVRKSHGSQVVLCDVALRVEFGQTVAVTGVSGAGKTTLLRIIAGVDRAIDGRLSWASSCIAGPQIWTPPWARPFAMVFQDYGLWPHLSVEQHLRFVKHGSRRHRATGATDVDHLLSVLDLFALRKRLPPDLSGGQQQRLAIGRALARDPDLLLLDEPLAHQDEDSRDKVWGEILQWQAVTQGTIIISTHDNGWAARHANSVFQLHEGKLNGAPGP